MSYTGVEVRGSGSRFKDFLLEILRHGLGFRV